MQYCSLPHRTFVSPPDTSTAGCCFCFRSASSFLLTVHRQLKKKQQKTQHFSISAVIIVFFPGGVSGEESDCQSRRFTRCGSIPGLGRSPKVRNGNLLQYSCLGISQEQKSLEGYSPWSCKELDVTEHTHTHIMIVIYTPIISGLGQCLSESRDSRNVG